MRLCCKPVQQSFRPRSICRKRLSVLCYSGSSDDLYSILCVPASASQSEIKAAYRRLVHDLHPDKAGQFGQAGASDAFLKCKQAYEVLSDVEQRRQYDEALAASGETAPKQGHSWNPYNVWMEAYSAAHSSSNGSSDSHHGADSTGVHGPDDYYAAQRMAAAATAAAGANSSGLSDFADPSAAHGTSNDEDASGVDANMQHSPAALRAALLQQHGLALEQFGSLEDALAALAERDERETVVGLAEGDYDSTWLS